MSRLSLTPASRTKLLHSILSWSLVAAFLFVAMYYATRDLLAVQSGDPDEGVYLGVARLLNHGHTYAEFFFDQFWLFPQILAVAMRLAGDSLQTGRLTVVAFSAAGLVAGVLLARQLGAGRAALLAIPFGILNHYYLAQSRVTMTDVPSIACMLLAVVAAGAFARDKRRVWIGASAVALTAGLLIKPLAIGFALPVGYMLVAARVSWSEGRVRQTEWRVRIDLRALCLDGLVFAATALLFAAPFVDLFDLPGEFQRTVGFHWDEKSWYAPALALRFNGLTGFVAENRMWLGLAALGVFAAGRRKAGLVVMLLLAQVISAAVLVQLPPWWHHYALLAPLLTIFAVVGTGAGLESLRTLARQLVKAPGSLSSRFGRGIWNGIAARRRAGLVVLLMPVAFLAGAGLWVHDAPQLLTYDRTVLGERAHDVRAVVRYLKQNTKEGDYVISDNPAIVYLAGCLLPPSAVNLPYESTFQFSPLSREKLEESVTRYPVTAIVVTGPYRRNPHLMEWIESNYPRVETVGGGGSNITFARVYTQGEPVTHAAPEPEQEETPTDPPEYIP